MKSQIFFIFKLQTNSIRYAAYTKLKAVSVINERSTVFTDFHFDITDFSPNNLGKRLVILDKTGKVPHVLNGIAESSWHIFINLGNYNLAVIGCALSIINGGSERNIAVFVGRRHHNNRYSGANIIFYNIRNFIKMRGRKLTVSAIYRRPCGFWGKKSIKFNMSLKFIRAPRTFNKSKHIYYLNIFVLFIVTRQSPLDMKRLSATKAGNHLITVVNQLYSFLGGG